MDIKPEERPASRISRRSTSSDTGQQPDTCGICLNKYNEGCRIPKSLICGHTLCLNCIKELISHTAKIGCPFCRKQTHSRCGDLPTNYQLLQLLQKLGLLSKSADSMPSTPLPAVEEDLPEIEKEYKDNFNALTVYYKSVIDEIQKSISDLGVSPAAVRPKRADFPVRSFLRYMTLGDVLASAKGSIHDLNLVMNEVDKHLTESRRLKEVVVKRLGDGSVTINVDSTLAIHREDIELESGPPHRMPSGVHEIPHYPLRRAVHTPPLQSPHVDADIFEHYGPDFDFFDYGEPPSDDDDDDYNSLNEEQLYISRWQFEPSPFQSPRESVSSVYVPPAVSWCDICNCPIPPDLRSQQIHEAGRRHRAHVSHNQRIREEFEGADTPNPNLIYLTPNDNPESSSTEVPPPRRGGRYRRRGQNRNNNNNMNNNVWGNIGEASSSSSNNNNNNNTWRGGRRRGRGARGGRRGRGGAWSPRNSDHVDIPGDLEFGANWVFDYNPPAYPQW